MRSVRLLICSALLVAGVISTSAAAADSRIVEPLIPDTPVFAAPIDGKGGVMNPAVYCSDWRVEPRVEWVLEDEQTGQVRSYAWRGTLPGLYFPRVLPGTYVSTTKAWCAGNKSKRVETVEVVEKTYETTMSRAEFRRIHPGMTKRAVRRIVGYGGRAEGAYGGKSIRSYDLMAFWAWSIVVYRDGRVVSKHWDVDHD